MKGGLIGFGYWGQILAKNLKNSEKNLTVFDISKKARQSAQKKGFKSANSLEELLESDDIQFLIIATAPSSHYSIAKKALEYKKHVLVEKPFGLLSEKKDSLFKKSKKEKKVLMIDYSFIYSPGFLELKKLMKGSKLKSYESFRMNEQLPVWNVSLSEDLLIHDLSMLIEIIPSEPLYCVCQSLEMNSSKAQTALILIVGSKWRAFIYVSRVFSEKTRLILVKTSKKAFEFKEIDRVHYIRSIDSRKAQHPTPLTGKSSLENMFEEFFNRISGKSKSDDELKYKKMSFLLKAINKSLDKNGKETKIQWC